MWKGGKKSNTLRVCAYFGDVRTRPYRLYVKNNFKKIFSGKGDGLRIQGKWIHPRKKKKRYLPAWDIPEGVEQ